MDEVSIRWLDELGVDANALMEWCRELLRLGWLLFPAKAIFPTLENGMINRAKIIFRVSSNSRFEQLNDIFLRKDLPSYGGAIDG